MALVETHTSRQPGTDSGRPYLRHILSISRLTSIVISGSKAVHLGRVVMVAIALWAVASTANAQTEAPSDPQVWMCHHELWELGAEPEAWAGVAKGCDVITLYIDRVARADLQDLRHFAEVVRRHDIEVAIECAGLCDWRASFGDRAAEMSFRDEFRKVKRFLDPIAEGGAGGRIDYLQIDGPFRRMLYQRSGRRMERNEYQTVDSAGRELVEVLKLWREAVPGIEFYLLTNFPHWGYQGGPGYHGWSYTGQGTQGWGDYAKILAKAVAVTTEGGIPLKGITVDNPYDYAIGEHRSNQPDVTKDMDWLARIRRLEDDVRTRGLRFGLIFNSQRAGDKETGSDQRYEEETLEFLDLYRESGGHPDNVIVQSWYHYPLHVVPETAPGTMTHLVGQVIERVRQK